MVQQLWKTVWEFHKMVNMDLPQNSEILLLGIYPRELKGFGEVWEVSTILIISVPHNLQPYPGLFYAIFPNDKSLPKMNYQMPISHPLPAQAPSSSYCLLGP